MKKSFLKNYRRKISFIFTLRLAGLLIILGLKDPFLRRERIRRQAQSRKIKRKEQIEALMNFIEAKLAKNKGLNQTKLQLINCQLCSAA